MRVTVTKKGDGRKLAGQRRKAGETFEVEGRASRVFCAVGFTTAATAAPARKKASKKAKKSYKRRDMTAESVEPSD